MRRDGKPARAKHKAVRAVARTARKGAGSEVRDFQNRLAESQPRAGVGRPGRSDRRPASWAVYRLDLAGWPARRPRRSAPICVVPTTTVAARPGHQGTGWGSP